MSLPKIILVPTDFGEPSEAALDTAIEYAKVFGSEIVLMHAYEIPIVGFPDGAVVATAELTSRLLEGAQAGLDRQIASRQGYGVTIRGVIKQGDAYRMVNETAEEVGAGLIALGTHGRKGLSRALIGSVAEKVVRTARVPVLTVHSGDVVKTEIGRPQVEEQRAPEVMEPPPPMARPQVAGPSSSRSPQSGRDLPTPLSHR
jgi:nucleotide-binding universal stress UspA family protein